MPRVTSAEHFRRHQLLLLIFEDESLQVLFGLLSLSKQLALHEYYGTRLSLSEGEFTARREGIDARDPSFTNEAGKSFRVIEDAFIAASRAHGVSDEQRLEIVRRHRSKPPRYSSVSAALALPKRGREDASVTVVPIAKPLDKQQFVRTVLAYVRWQMENPDYVRDNSKAAVRSTPVPTAKKVSTIETDAEAA